MGMNDLNDPLPCHLVKLKDDHLLQSLSDVRPILHTSLKVFDKTIVPGKLKCSILAYLMLVLGAIALTETK